MIDTYANHVSLDVWSVSQLNAIMKCGHLDSQEIRTCEMQLKDIWYCNISGNGTGRCVTTSVPSGRVLKAFPRVFVIEENRSVHQQII